jgi:hypothetical protein
MDSVRENNGLSVNEQRTQCENNGLSVSEQWTQRERATDSVLDEQALHVIIIQTPMGADKRGKIERKFKWDGFGRFGVSDHKSWWWQDSNQFDSSQGASKTH